MGYQTGYTDDTNGQNSIVEFQHYRHHSENFNPIDYGSGYKDSYKVNYEEGNNGSFKTGSQNAD